MSIQELTLCSRCGWHEGQFGGCRRFVESGDTCESYAFVEAAPTWSAPSGPALPAPVWAAPSGVPMAAPVVVPIDKPRAKRAPAKRTKRAPAVVEAAPAVVPVLADPGPRGPQRVEYGPDGYPVPVFVKKPTRRKTMAKCGLPTWPLAKIALYRPAHVPTFKVWSAEELAAMGKTAVHSEEWKAWYAAMPVGMTKEQERDYFTGAPKR